MTKMNPVTTAMILAAGRGERMRPLTDHTPKPLLKVRGKTLIEYHIEKLTGLGFSRIVINHAWLGEQLEQQLGNGSLWGTEICYSAEDPVLETAGGIAKALPLLGDSPFLLVNGDVWTDFDFSQLQTLEDGDLAKLVMVDNPEHNPQGNFALCDSRLYIDSPRSTCPKLTYAGIALYHPTIFLDIPLQKLALRPILDNLIAQNKVSGLHHRGQWSDVGTPERLQMLNDGDS